MGFFEFIGILVVVYYCVIIFLWLILDSDIELAFKEFLGYRISSLESKVVWITGASSGIGKDLALILAKHGVKLALTARREDQLELVRQECIASSKGMLKSQDVLVFSMDMLAIKRHKEYFDKVINHFGTLDILVNNAGRSQRANWTEIDIQVDRDLFELDVFSVVNLSRIAVRYFKSIPDKKGHIAVTSSGAGLTIVPFSATYCAAKHSLNGYFGSLTMEEQVDVTIFCPGPVATPFLEESFTANPDQKYGVPIGSTERRMSSERCAKLYATALANKTILCWVGLFPVSFLIYLCLYFPNLKFLLFKFLGSKGIGKIREGR